MMRETFRRTTWGLRIAIMGALASTLLLTACAGIGARDGSGGLEPATTSVGAPDGRANKETLAPYGAGADSSAVEERGSITDSDRKIVVNKTLRIETKDVEKAVEQLRALASREEGEIESLQISTADDQPIYIEPLPGDATMRDRGSDTLRAYVTVRVPAERYDAFVTEASKLGRVLFHAENAQDVTQQHIDMSARLESLKVEQSRLRQLFARADTVRDLLAIEQELARVQGEIESLQGQFDFLNRQVAMATVTFELTEPEPIGSPTGTDWGVREAFNDSIRAFVGTVNGLIVLLGPVVALLLLVGLPVWLVTMLILKRIRKRKVVTAAPAAEPTEGTSEEISE